MPNREAIDHVLGLLLTSLLASSNGAYAQDRLLGGETQSPRESQAEIDRMIVESGWISDRQRRRDILTNDISPVSASPTRAQKVQELAIDDVAPAPTETADDVQRRQEEELHQLRREVTKLENQFDFSLYQSYRAKSGPGPAVPGALSGGVIPSQGGAEVAFTPPKIGFRDERIFQVYGRVLWSNDPNSISIDGDTLQGGVGARYKPLREQSLWLSVERLIKVGDLAQNSWLARVMYGWQDGYDVKPLRDSWNYTLFYGDAGYFFNGDVFAFYGEARQGWTFNFGDRVLLTPHVIVDGRAQTPNGDTTNYAEVGAGVSLRYLFRESFYRGTAGSFETLVYWKKGFENSPGGFAVTAVLLF